MNKIVLTKASNSNEIRAYFEGVMRLASTNEKFPVNLDEVWPLVYNHRKDAIRVLKTHFMEGVDFQPERKNAQRSGGRFNNGNQVDYLLSTSCLEYFIARKVRPVFEVYRQVFHQVTQPKLLTQSEMLLQSVQMLVAQEQKVAQLEDKVNEIDARTKTRSDYFTIVGYGSLNGFNVNISLACRLGQKAARICKARGIPTDSIPDPRFGTVKMYPKDVLIEVFESAI